jgi:phospholipid transport system transporter-binding protein
MQLPATVTMATAGPLTQSVAAAAQDLGGQAAGSPVRIDAAALTHFDTAALALLLHARRAAKQAGRSFEVVGAPAKLRKLAQLYGVEELLALQPSA